MVSLLLPAGFMLHINIIRIEEACLVRISMMYKDNLKVFLCPVALYGNPNEVHALENNFNDLY